MSRIFSFLLIGMLATGGSIATGKDAVSPQDSLGRQAPAFTLRDQYGKPHALADYADRKLVVLAFLGNECPLVRLYAGRLEQIANDYARGVTVLGVNANRQDALTEIATFAQQQKLTFPMLKDAGNVVADVALRLAHAAGLRARCRAHGCATSAGSTINTASAFSAADRDAPRSGRGARRILAGKKSASPRPKCRGCLIGRVREGRAARHRDVREADFAVAQRTATSAIMPATFAPFPA